MRVSIQGLHIGSNLPRLGNYDPWMNIADMRDKVSALERVALPLPSNNHTDFCQYGYSPLQSTDCKAYIHRLSEKARDHGRDDFRALCKGNLNRVPLHPCKTPTCCFICKSLLDLGIHLFIVS